MKKKILLMLALALTLTACQKAEEKKAESKKTVDTVKKETKEEKKEAYNLEGEWKQVNSKSKETWQSAIIKDGKITVNWISDNGDTSSLYWEGTYDKPKVSSGTFKWESKNDKSKTGGAMLASNADTKEFAFDGKQLSYEVSAMGSTTKVKLEKVK